MTTATSSRLRLSLLAATLCIFLFVTLRSQIHEPVSQQSLEHASEKVAEVAPAVVDKVASVASTAQEAAPVVADKVASVGSTAKNVFSKIYESNYWGSGHDPEDKFYSGVGSHDEAVVRPYVDAVRGWIQKKFDGKAPRALDLGCGDFNVGQQIRNVTGTYTAADVVPSVIEHNKKVFASENVDFQVVDIITDKLPEADVVFLRQVLQHLNNAQIATVLPKLKQFEWAVITEHMPENDDFTPNLDIETGKFRVDEVHSGTDLTAEPFNMHYIQKQVIMEVHNQGRIRTTAYKLR